MVLVKTAPLTSFNFLCYIYLMKKKIIFIIIIVLLAGTIFYKRMAFKAWFLNLRNEPVPEAVSYQNFINQNVNQKPLTNQNININLNTNQKINSNNNINNNQITNNQLPIIDNSLPETFNLRVPFTSQAPHYQWKEMPYKEGCEEAALLIVHYYYQGKDFTPDIADEEIVKMVNWQIDNWEGHYDLTATQTALLVHDYFGYQNVETILNPTIEMIKEEVYQGHPVILPTAGRMLNNPYFTPPGPLYHMLVIKGWTENNFITNDPGLFKKGRDYQYLYQIVMNAIHDWNGGDVNNGQKIMLIVKN